MLRHLPFAFAVLPALLPAQQPTATSPAGLLSTAGTTSQPLGSISFFGSTLYSQYLQLDDSRIGAPQVITAVHLRVPPAYGGPGPQTATVMMRMAHGDSSQLTPGYQSVDDALVGSWATVIAPRTVQLPDLSTPSPSSPAPWSIPLVLDQPFSYDGVHGLYLQLAFYDPAGGLLTLDVDAIAADARQRSESIQGPGCAIGQGSLVTTTDTVVPADATVTPTMEIRVAPHPAPNTLATLLTVFGYQQQNVGIGLCVPLWVSDDVIVPVTGSSLIFNPPNSTVVGKEVVPIPYSPQIVGIELFAQSFGLHVATGTVIGSDAIRTGPFPARNTVAPVWGAWDFGPGGSFLTQASFVPGNGIVIGLE